MAVGVIGGAVIGAIANYVAQERAIDAQKENREDLQDFQYQYTHDRWGLNRAGLEEAGYNPLLALGISPNAGGPTTGMSVPDMDATANNAGQIANRMAQLKVQNSQAGQNNATTKLNTQKVIESKQTTANMSQTLENLKVNNDQLQQELAIKKLERAYYEKNPDLAFGMEKSAMRGGLVQEGVSGVKNMWKGLTDYIDSVRQSGAKGGGFSGKTPPP